MTPVQTVLAADLAPGPARDIAEGLFVLLVGAVLVLLVIQGIAVWTRGRVRRLQRDIAVLQQRVDRLDGAAHIHIDNAERVDPVVEDVDDADVIVLDVQRNTG